jgi:hypothetical protein
MKPYGGSADLISAMERLKLLQRELSPFKKQEWHNKGYRDEFKSLLVKAFGQLGWTTAQQKISLKHHLSNQVGLQVQRWKIVHLVVKTGRDDTGCGRWSYITFNGKENNHITAINTYIMCSQRDRGDTTAYIHQQCVQYADEELIPYVLDPHRQTLIDLQ